MATVHGLTANTIYPQPDFKATRDETGKWSASRTYVVSDGSFKETLAAKFARGNLISVIDNQISIPWSFLVIQSADVTKEEGFDSIAVQFVGYSEWEIPDNPDDETNIVYELSSVDREQSIFKHKTLLDDFAGQYDMLRWIKGWVDGKMYLDKARATAEGYTNPDAVFYNSQTQRAEGEVTGTDRLEWWRKIRDEDLRTYEESTVEWSKTLTDKTPLVNADVRKLSWIDGTITGSPPTTTTSANWRLKGLNETLQDEVATKNWRWLCSWPSDTGGWDSKTYTKP